MSLTGSRSTSKYTRRSEHSSHSGSHKSGGSNKRCGTSLLVVRAKEASRMAELKAAAAILKRRQFLEEQRFRLKQDKKPLTLENVVKKSKAREDALASMDPNRRLVVPDPTGVESKPRSVVPNQTASHVPVQSLPVGRGFFTLNPEAPEWQHHATRLTLVTRVHYLHLVKGPSTRCGSCTSTRIYYSNSRTRSLRCL